MELYRSRPLVIRLLTISKQKKLDLLSADHGIQLQLSGEHANDGRSRRLIRLYFLMSSWNSSDIHSIREAERLIPFIILFIQFSSIFIR